MKNFKSLFLLVFFAAGLIACNNTDLEQRLTGLEKRVAELEGGKPKPADLTLAQNVQTAEEVPAGPAPKFKFEEEEFDFGNIKEGDVVSHTFKFTNVGEGPLVIQNASASCGCTVPNWTKTPIPVGETGEVHVKFDSSNKPGVQNKTVTITANTIPEVTRLTIKSVVNPKPGSAQAEGPVKSNN